MKLKLRDVEDQVIVLTGATSGIGLVTARMAAERGARLVLNSRNEDALRELVEEIRDYEGQAVASPGDVADPAAMRELGNRAVREYGRIDTWVNNAGISIYGRIEDVPIEEHRRLFETNFWGVVYGSLEAVSYLRAEGGALINVGSILSDRAVPLQGMYSAAKHAVKGFTDALRMELEHDGAPISVTLVKPGAIDTPYTEHAKNYLEYEPKNPAPLYAPETVARVILYCAERPEREVIVGGGGKAISALGSLAPRIADKIMERTMFSAQQSDRPALHPDPNSLFEPGRDLQERGNSGQRVMESSIYTRAALHPVMTGVAGLALVGLIAAMSRRSSSEEFRPSL